MTDAHDWTDKQLEAINKRIAKVYTTASKEMTAKLKAFMKDFNKELEQREKSLDNTEEGQERHQAWLESQTARAAWFREMTYTLSQEAVKYDEKAANAINDKLPTVYAENANMAAYEVDRGIQRDTMFSLVDETTVERLAAENPRLLPNAKIDIPKDQRWNQRKITSAVTQGILQGESMPKIAKRLQSVVTMDRNAAMRAARLAVTGAENAGRVSSYERAKAMGINLKQEWLATLDGRTRHSHRMLDGERVEVGEKFSNGCKYPGDPDGPGSEIYNCRCTLIAAIGGIDTSDAQRWSRLPEGVTYEDWKGSKIAMSKRTSAMWPNDGVRLSGERYENLVAYAYSKNVRLHASFENAIVDVAVAKNLIDATAKAAAEFPEVAEKLDGRAFMLVPDYYLGDKDFASVEKSKRWQIHINAFAIRDEAALIREYNEAVADDWFVSGTTYEAIIYHEFGHLFEKCYNINAREVASDILGTRNEKVLESLIESELSGYAAKNLDGEITSEVMAAWLSKTENQFAGLFMARVSRK